MKCHSKHQLSSWLYLCWTSILYRTEPIKIDMIIKKILVFFLCFSILLTGWFRNFKTIHTALIILMNPRNKLPWLLLANPFRIFDPQCSSTSYFIWSFNIFDSRVTDQSFVDQTMSDIHNYKPGIFDEFNSVNRLFRT